jgi:hypothetical protein
MGLRLRPRPFDSASLKLKPNRCWVVHRRFKLGSVLSKARKSCRLGPGKGGRTRAIEPRALDVEHSIKLVHSLLSLLTLLLFLALPELDEPRSPGVLYSENLVVTSPLFYFPNALFKNLFSWAIMPFHSFCLREELIASFALEPLRAMKLEMPFELLGVFEARKAGVAGPLKTILRKLLIDNRRPVHV